MTMDYTVTMASGEVWTMRGDFAQASSPIRNVFDGDEYPTPFQVADARHSPVVAAEMLVAYWANQGGDSGDKIESVEGAHDENGGAL